MHQQSTQSDARALLSSRAGMRELLRAVWRRKPIITVLEPDVRKGGMTKDRIEAQLRAGCPATEQADDSERFRNWRLRYEMEKWPMEGMQLGASEECLERLPTADDVLKHLFKAEPLEWNRVEVRAISNRSRIFGAARLRVTPTSPRPMLSPCPPCS